MIILDLPYTFDSCPKHWQNMIYRIEKFPDSGVTKREINRELKRFNARYFSVEGYVEFADEAGYNWYLLTYS